MFTATWRGNGFYEIKFKYSGKSLDVAEGGTLSGTNVQRYEDNNTDAQQWLFIPWGGGNSARQEIPDDEYEIVSTVDENKSLQAAHHEIAAGTNMILKERNANGKTIFQVQYLGKGYYAITEENSGLSLDVANGSYRTGANVQLWTQNSSDAQQCFSKSCGDGSYNIISKKATYLDDSSTKAEDGVNVHMWNGLGLTN